MSRGERLLLGATLLWFAGFGAAYCWITPFGQAPDEASHTAYAQLIAQHVQLPLAAQALHQQPPLYYLVAAAVARAGGDFHALRLLSLLFGVATIAVIALAVRRLLPARPLLGVGAAAMFAALPEAQYIAASVSNESLTWLAGALTFFCLIEVMRVPAVSARLALTCGAIVGVDLLTKQTVWVLALLLVVTVLLQHRHTLRALRVVQAGGVAVLIAAWWFVRNETTFHALTPPVGANPGHLLRSLSQVRGFISATLDSTVGMYANQLSFRVIQVLDIRTLPSLLVGVAAVVVAALVVVALRRRGPAWDGLQRRLAGVLAAGCALVLILYVLNSVLFDLQPQARYLFVLAVPVSGAIAWSLWVVLPRSRAWLLPLLGAAAAVLDVSGLLTASRLPP